MELGGAQTQRDYDLGDIQKLPDFLSEPTPDISLVGSSSGSTLLPAWLRSVNRMTLGIPNKQEKMEDRVIYKFTTDVFLRHLPTSEREKIVSSLVRRTRNYASWEKKDEDEGGAMTIDPIVGNIISVYPGRRRSEYSIHEAIHFLQYEGHMPFNNALTFASTRLLSLLKGENDNVFLPFPVDPNKSYPGSSKPSFTADQYYDGVLSNNTAGFLQEDWKLQKGPDNNSGCNIYLDKEEEFNREFARNGEFIKNVLGIKDPYAIMKGIGKARGVRAYAMGRLSGNMNNAFTLLWQHSMGKPFEQAEKEVVQKLKNGTIGEYYS